MKKVLTVIFILLALTVVAIGGLYAYQVYIEEQPIYPSPREIFPLDKFPVIDKPVIYLYPKETKNVSVKLLLSGDLLYSYPEYKEGWNVTAYPDGRIVNSDGKEYSYLFWESSREYKFKDINTGFVVRGEYTKEFLQEKLSKMGLTPKEYNEMIVYWFPKMESNEYNFVHFAGKEYTDNARLQISPEPDSILRVFMVYKPLKEYIDIKPQEFESFERKGFTVVEWGGTEL